MSFFDDASLVMIPSGYKDQKVYSVKPTDGTGDLTFSRASDATRVASNGLIEKVRTNLALQSETLDNASWTKNRSTITANALVNPVNGATTADYIVEDTATGTHEVIQTFTVSAGISYTISVYAKADTRTKIALVLAGSGFASGGNGQAIFNLSTGVVISAINGATARISDAGNGWYRCSITKASIDTAGVIALELVDASDNTSYTGNGTSRAAFFGAQFEVSDFGATDYIATTTAAVSVGPVSGLPRLDYLGSTCPRLLLEPQRTNVATYSEQLDNAAWGNAAAVTANSVVSPDGYTNADTVTGILSQLVSYTSGTAYTFSVFAKKNSGSTLTLRADATAIQTCTFNLDTIVAGAGGTMTNYGNGWYRCAFTFTANATATGVVYIVPPTSVYLYGCQHELGAYATSYIPTLGASVTRVADFTAKTGVSSLIGQTEGTLFVDFTINGLADYGTPISVNDGSIGNYIWLTIFANGTLRAELYNGAAQASITFFGPVVVGRYKMAFGYKTNDFVLYVNGALVGTDLTGTTFSGTTLSRVDTNLTNGSLYSLASESINQALLFKTRLTNSQLAELTA
jgi:hypothetical protein